ncbi:DUF6804 family protein [Chryseobacterium lathyri]|uniref:Uncharacterized protein n=1 Tax=Chryseobacterium lathyri TaxID=395933 RepID=A0ABT9SHG6_9FLAO|nr:DUF6804 family protein [Chryseobacterium lathyri]MDP9958868.1 hypothetical protein [Chryseobacterium lathyri]MDQ0066904.1 hypothetical protein [Chryseobacterium lathyri]
MKPFLTLCAICCFVAIFRLPIEYYTILRILISMGALLVLYNAVRFKQYYFSLIFLFILILFNPVFPIYLYRKSVWIPVDIITGILFLLIAFVEKPEEKKEEIIENPEEATTYPTQPRAHARDIIINPKKPKEN